MIKNLFLQTKSKIKTVVMVLSLCFFQANLIFASSAQGLVDDGFLVVEAIPGVLAVFCFVQGGMALAESKMEGASAQASGKAFGFISAGVVLAIVVALIELKFKSRVLGFFGS